MAMKTQTKKVLARSRQKKSAIQMHEILDFPSGAEKLVQGNVRIVDKRNPRRKPPKKSGPVKRAVKAPTLNQSVPLKVAPVPNFLSNDINALGVQSPNAPTGTDTYVVSGAEAAHNMLASILDPWQETSGARWPDNYSMIPTFVSKDMAHLALTIYNGTSANDGCAGLYFRGDPVCSYAQPSSIATATSSYAITWHDAWSHLYSSMPYSTTAAASAFERPAGTGVRFTFSGVGPYHSIIARVMELPPNGPIDSGFPNFPTNANLGPTFAQREYYRAREITLNPGDTLVCTSYPADARGFMFLPFSDSSPQAREYFLDYSSWSGYIIWFFGLSSLDTVYADLIHRHEYYMPVTFSAPSTQPMPKGVVTMNTIAKEVAENVLVKEVGSGWNVFKTVLNTAASIFTTLAPMLFSPSPSSAVAVPLSANAAPPINDVAFNQAFEELEEMQIRWRGQGERLRYGPGPSAHPVYEQFLAKLANRAEVEEKKEDQPPLLITAKDKNARH